MANLQWTNAKLKQIGTSDEMQYDDAFTMQEIEAEDVANFNYIAGMVPFIQKIIADVSLHLSNYMYLIPPLFSYKHPSKNVKLVF